jgi:hypothetical protein
MIRLRRVSRQIPWLRFYEVELSPPDADSPWLPEKPVWSISLRRRLIAEGIHERDATEPKSLR